EAARVESRPIEVELVGEDLELDRSTQDRAYEPLLHAVRNAIAHGIEKPEARLAAGKPPIGRVTLEARNEGTAIVLSVRDDGRGPDLAAIEAKGRQAGLIAPGEVLAPDQLRALIFRPGFSTASEAGTISGRGVGMDAIVQEASRLHGTVDLDSVPSRGTNLSL